MRLVCGAKGPEEKKIFYTVVLDGVSLDFFKKIRHFPPLRQYLEAVYKRHTSQDIILCCRDDAAYTSSTIFAPLQLGGGQEFLAREGGCLVPS